MVAGRLLCTDLHTSPPRGHLHRRGNDDDVDHDDCGLENAVGQTTAGRAAVELDPDSGRRCRRARILSGRSEYRATGADRGHSLSMRVTATPATGSAGSAESAPVFVQTWATVVVKPNRIVGDSRTEFAVEVGVRLLAPDVVATGIVTVKVDGETFEAELTEGAVTVRIGRQDRGVHPISVSYRGSDAVLPAKGVSLIVVLR
jgi:hypothetical protein